MAVSLIAASLMRGRVRRQWAAAVGIALVTFVVWYVSRAVSGYLFDMVQASG